MEPQCHSTRLVSVLICVFLLKEPKRAQRSHGPKGPKRVSKRSIWAHGPIRALRALNPKSKTKELFVACLASAVEAMCDGKRAEERANWLVQNQGMTSDAARRKVMDEFPRMF